MTVGTSAYTLDLLANLKGKVIQAAHSPHANYILQKFIELVPAEQLDFVVSEVEDDVIHVARNRFGCRILQRLLEQCKLWQVEKLIINALANGACLCRHQYGNFILQHILQYGSKSQRKAVADLILVDIIRLSKHRLASHIVTCALIHCSPEDVHRLTRAVLHDETELYNLSRREYGSFVVREAHRAVKLLENVIEEDNQKEHDPRCGLQADTDTLGESGHATYAAVMERQCSGQSQCTNYADIMERQCTIGVYMD